MSPRIAAPAVFLPLLVLVLLQRAIELHRARLHTRSLIARGGVEHGREHYPLLVGAHAIFYLLWTLEVLWRRPPVTIWTLAWLGVFALAQVARLWVLATLGERWTTRVIVVPGEALVRRGPYRFVRHPNYLVVVIEKLALAAAFRAWVTLAVIAALQALVLGVRIRVEERALRGRSG